MLKTYLTIAWRQLQTNKVFSAINILGLAASLAVCMAILLYWQHEHSYDDFHKKGASIRLITERYLMGDQEEQTDGMSYRMADVVKQYLPAVDETIRISTPWSAPVIQVARPSNPHYAEKDFLFADSNFFNFFSFKLAEGNPATCLARPFCVVISRAASIHYFGTADPMGKTILYNGKYLYTVTGLAEDAPSNSSISFQLIGSMSSQAGMEDTRESVTNTRLAGGPFKTYLHLKPGFREGNLAKDITTLLSRLDHETKKPGQFNTIPLKEVHLRQDSNEAASKYISLFPLIGMLILALALTNYISLSTSKATLRGKEIGIRKTIGAGRRSIAAQFITETILFTFIAFVIGYLLCYFLEDKSESYLNIRIDRRFLYSPRMLIAFGELFVVTVIVASMYPAALLSSFEPIRVLNGKLGKMGQAVTVRKFITVFQLAISAGLIIAGMTINRQVSFMRNSYTGMNRQNVIMIDFPPAMGRSFPAFRSDIAALTGVDQVAVNHWKMYDGMDRWLVRSPAMPKTEFLSAYNVDSGFISLLKLQWSVAPDDPKYYQKQGKVVLNEEAMKILKLKPGVLHQQFTVGEDRTMEIAGILKDFNFESLEKKIGPMALLVAEDTSEIWRMINGSLMAKIGRNVDRGKLIGRMKAVYEMYDQSQPFNYSFVDDSFQRMYQTEQRLSKVFMVCIAITISIASLGLFGLITFMTGQRVREIGIRKVLGASVSQIVRLLSKDFVVLVLLGCLIGLPVALYAMNGWLDHFAYRIALRWWTPALAIFIVLLLALGTVSIQSIKSALMNPVKSLKNG